MSDACLCSCASEIIKCLISLNIYLSNISLLYISDGMNDKSGFEILRELPKTKFNNHCFQRNVTVDILFNVRYHSPAIMISNT